MPPVNLPRNDDPATDILNLDAFPPTGTPKYEKLASWEFYRSIGSPKNVVAPMVDQSELAWRILSRRHGADVVYTPMINSRRFTQSTSQPRGHYHDVDFWIAKDKDLQEEGSSTIPSTGHQDTDNPVIVQFCANDPDLLLQAARVVERYCNAVDLNLGCPQQIARRGHYGSFLQSDWQLIFRLINTLHINLRVPVTAKMRVFDCVERTVAYAKMLERAGAQIIAVHGRTREMKGHKTGIADWLKIRAVKEAVSVPVFANGNVLFHQDVQRALEATGADGVMSAEGNLYNPAIFANAPESPTELYPLVPTFPFPRIVTLAREYLDICEALHTPMAGSAIKAHFFRLARPALEVHRDLRPILGKASLDRSASGKQKFSALRAFVDRLAELLEADEKDEKYLTLIEQSKAAAPSIWKASPDQEPNYIPHWLAQPYYRKTMPPKDEDSQVAEERREKRKLRLQETAVGLASINDLQALNDDGVSAKILQDAEGSAPVSSKRIKVG
jgi:tRNA-dihydrouridine synthase 1